MQPVAQHDEKAARLRVDPQRGAGIARVSERPRREERRKSSGVRRVDVPAQTAQDGLAVRALRPRHFRDGLRSQDAWAPRRDGRQQHAREQGQVIGGCEQPGVAGDTTHPIGDWILNLAPAQLEAFDVCRRDAVPQRGGRAKPVSRMPSGWKMFVAL